MEQELFKAIFKIEGDASSAMKALDDLNKKYEQTTDLAKDQQRELKKLQDEEAKLMLGRAKAQNTTQAAKYNTLLQEQAEKIAKLKQFMAQTANETSKLKKESDSLNKSLTQAFDGARVAGLRGEMDKASNSTKSLRSQLKDLKAQLAVTTDDAEFIRLSAAAGELQDKLNDATEAANIFATGSKFDSFGRALKGVAGDLINLDFEGAASKAKLLEKASKAITFKDGLAGIGQLGTTLATVGKALLTNPIFLIGGAVTLIISNFDKLKNAGGLVGDIFGGLSNIVSTVTSKFLSFTDAIGLTATALDDYNKRVAADFERNITVQSDSLERQIKLMRALGQETSALEIKRIKLGMRASELQLRALQPAVDDINRRNANLPAGVAKMVLQPEVQKAYDDAKKIVDDGNAEIRLIQISYNEKRKKEAEETEKYINSLRFNPDDYANQNEEIAEIEAKALTDYKKNEQEKTDELRKQTQSREEIDLDNSAQSVEIEKQAALEKEKIAKELWEKKLSLLNQELDGISTVTNAAINSVTTIVSAQQKLVDTQINLQSKKVNDTRAIAEKGNAELLELEQKRLDDLNAKRERFVQQQQTLALIELTANSTIAIAKAAAQGGAAAPFTIAATLLALGAGFIQARTLAANQGFYKGGYTGDGDPHGESTALGRKPYTYHKAEFVFNHEKTRKYRDIFDEIHRGNIDLRDWQSKVDAFESMRFNPSAGSINIDVESLRSELKSLRKTVENQSAYINFDENGLAARFSGLKVRQDFIKNFLAK